LIRRHGMADLFLRSEDAGSGAMSADRHVGRNMAHVQRVIEGESFEIRRTLRKYSYVLERQRRLMHERRQKLLSGAVSPSLLREREPDLFEKLVGEFGQELVQTVERQITLCQIDGCWSDYLSHVAEIRAGLHLRRICGP